ncbi:copper chaperone PCu(A)C [Aliikangiella sp. IMCC44653]
MKFYTRVSLLVLCFLFVLQVKASPASPANLPQAIKVSEVVMPKLPEVSRTAAIYLNIENLTDSAITLTDVDTSAARHVMMHETKQVEGVSKMRHHDSIIIQPHSVLEFKPGSYHIMLMGLIKEKMNQPFKLKLSFKEHPSIDVVVTPK